MIAETEAIHELLELALRGDSQAKYMLVGLRHCPACGKASLRYVKRPGSTAATNVTCRSCRWELVQRQVHDKAADEAGTIYQSELAELMVLRAISDRCTELRNKLVKQLDNGAEIEPGPLTLELDRHQEQRMNWTSLGKYAGTEVYNSLRYLVPKTIQQRLSVMVADE